MAKDTSGVWSITVGPVKPDLYPYNFSVDGLSVADPNNPYIFPNERFKASLVDVPGDAPPVYSLENIPHGTVTYRYYHSKSLGLMRPWWFIRHQVMKKAKGPTRYCILYMA